MNLYAVNGRESVESVNLMDRFTSTGDEACCVFFESCMTQKHEALVALNIFFFSNKFLAVTFQIPRL